MDRIFNRHVVCYIYIYICIRISVESLYANVCHITCNSFSVTLVSWVRTAIVQRTVLDLRQSHIGTCSQSGQRYSLAIGEGRVCACCLSPCRLMFENCTAAYIHEHPNPTLHATHIRAIDIARTHDRSCGNILNISERIDVDLALCPILDRVLHGFGDLRELR